MKFSSSFVSLKIAMQRGKFLSFIYSFFTRYIQTWAVNKSMLMEVKKALPSYKGYTVI